MPDQKYAEALDVPVTPPVREMTKTVRLVAWTQFYPIALCRAVK
jgi:hypothetical protein